ncbi:MAG: hypothetical protein HFG28_12005 [Eubacterium sp.]|nr:hypothetical protein [Eubacterium sp.]
MRKKNFKGRCTKRSLSKCEGICRTYDAVQSACANMLQGNDEVISFRCNVLLDGLAEGEYTSDFVCEKKDGEIMVCECILRGHLMKPLTVRLLDLSRNYWLKHSVSDCRIVIDEDK